MAIERINKDPYYNRNGEIQLSLVACRSVSEIASFFRIPQISWVATDPDLNDKETYSTLARTLGPFSKLGEFLLEVFSQYKWKRVVLLSSNYLLYLDAAKAIRKVFNENNLTIAYESKYDRFPPDNYIIRTLLKTKLEGRIVVLICPLEDRRRFMLKAHDLGMTEGEYVFYTIDMLPEENILNPESVWKGNDGRDIEAQEAFKAVFHVSLAALSNARVTRFRQEVGQRMRSPPYNEHEVRNGDKYSPFLYDAVLIYVMALNETLNKGLDPTDGMNVVNNLRQKVLIGKIVVEASQVMTNPEYAGITGNLVLDDLGDREPDYWISDMNPFTGSFVKIAEVLNKDLGVRVNDHVTNSKHNFGVSFQEFRKNILPPEWPSGEVGHEFAPPDTPVCGFLGEKCEKEKVATWIIVTTAVSSGALVTAVVILTIYLYRKNKFETDLLIQSWKINKDEIEMINYVRGTGSKAISSATMSSASMNSGSTISKAKTETKSSQLKSMVSFGSTQQQQVFADCGYYRGQMVALKKIKKEHMQLSRAVLMEFKE
ncbi:hypothetical protein CAPTEDRAFT_189897, partial [Capitella teleta]